MSKSFLAVYLFFPFILCVRGLCANRINSFTYVFRTSTRAYILMYTYIYNIRTLDVILSYYIRQDVREGIYPGCAFICFYYEPNINNLFFILDDFSSILCDILSRF